MNNLSPIQWALRPLKRYASFSGRSSRAEFWWFFLFVMVIFVAMYFALIATVMGAGMSMTQSSATDPSAGLIGAFGAMGVLGIIMLLFWLGMFIPTLAVQVRRLHDTGHSGWWLGGYWLLYLVYIALLFANLSSAMSDAATGDPTAPPQVNGGMVTLTMILGLVMFIYGIALLVFFCLRGTAGPNRYGPDPYGSDVEQVFA